jgi:hypothetical protein
MAENLNVVVGADVQGLERGLQAAGQSIQRFDAVTKKSTASIAQANTSLTNLARVAQDAPFGFIAIANNLDPLVSSLQNLSRESGGTGKAILSLGSALIGPAGLALGFSVASSAITTLIQKYGSFGAAVQALTGSLSDQAKAQNIINKELTDNIGQYTQQIAQLSTLASLSQDVSIGYEQQAKASKLLRQEVDGIVVSQDLAKNKQEELSAGTIDYAKKVIAARVTLQGFNQVIGQTATEYAKAVVEGASFTDFFVGAVNKITSFVTALKGGNIELAGQIARLDFAALAQKRYQDRVDGLKRAIGTSVNALSDFTRQQIAAGIQIDDLFGKEIKGEKESQREKKKTTAEAKRQTEELRNRRAELERFEFVNDRIRARALERPTGIEQLMQRAQEAARQQQQQSAQQQFLGLGQIGGTGGAVERARQQISRFIAATDEARAASLGALQSQAENITTVFASTLGPAIDGIFNALASGQDVIKNLGLTFKRLLIDIAATVIKTLALQAILAALSGGASAGVTAAVGGAASLLRGVTGAAGGGVRRVSAPTFSGAAGINGGGIQLAGQVVFVQRGPDLVGVLNQGNARIGRVG